jgi:hypothetical protein
MRGRVGKGKGGLVSSAAEPLTLPGLGASRRRRRADLPRGAKMIRESTIREACAQEKFPPDADRLAVIGRRLARPGNLTINTI